MQGHAQTPVFEILESLLSKHWLLRLINLSVMLLLCASLAQWTWQLLPFPKMRPVAVAKPSHSVDQAYDLRTLLEANLFGKPAEQAKKAPAVENIPLSSLNLVLTGVVVRGADSYAVISARGSPEAPFMIGQEIVAGAVLDAVRTDRVIIRRAGARESLMLKETAPVLPAGSLLVPQGPQRTAVNTVTQSGRNSFTVDRQQLTHQLQRPDFLKQAAIVPNAGGGFLVRSIAPGSIYEKFGLRPGDVIRSINGERVNTLSDVMKIYQQTIGAGQATTIVLDVLRAGKTEQLQYYVQ